MNEQEMRERYNDNYVQADGAILLIHPNNYWPSLVAADKITVVHVSNETDATYGVMGTIYGVRVAIQGRETEFSFHTGEDVALAEEFLGVFKAQWLASLQHMQRR